MSLHSCRRAAPRRSWAPATSARTEARVARWLLLGVALALGAAARAEMFDFEMLRHRAKLIAAQPYAQPANAVPEALRKLSYDDYRLIEFEPAASLWRSDARPFEAQFFHPGYLHDRTVKIRELRGKRAEEIPFHREWFNYHALKTRRLPDATGYAGFRLLYPLNHENDELGVFLGASYFRFLCQRASYGLSARGLALNTAEPGGEEFPAFTEFWLERPAENAKTINVYALLETETGAGAYHFTITPGAETIVQVQAAIYCRRNVRVFGVAPLTSMFWRGENSPARTEDFRPEVHDSDGLLINTGGGEWLWRPLTDPAALRIASFADENPRGFGLLQRDRNFESYQDLEAAYQSRPSAWVEPIGKWGRGSIRLVEIPTPNEFNDNIVAFWVPDQLPAPGSPIDLDYRLHWCLDQIRPPGGYAVATRIGRSPGREPELARIVVDFDGAYLHQQAADPAIEPVVTIGAGAQLVHSALQKNPVNGTWRVTLSLKPEGAGHPVELRCFLRKNTHALTETWSYLWQP